MPVGLKRAAKVKTPPRPERSFRGKRGMVELADGTQGTAVAAAAGRRRLAVAWTACFLTALVSVVKLLPFGTIGLDQVNHRL